MARDTATWLYHTLLFQAIITTILPSIYLSSDIFLNGEDTIWAQAMSNKISFDMINGASRLENEVI